MAKNCSRSIREQLANLFPDQQLPHDPSLPDHWCRLSFFKCIKDNELLTLTSGDFPRLSREKVFTERNTHPVLLLDGSPSTFFKFCPCTSKTYNAWCSSYIPAGTRFEPFETERYMNVDSYILHHYQFNLPAYSEVIGPENFVGIVPEGAIHGDAYKGKLHAQ